MTATTENPTANGTHLLWNPSSMNMNKTVCDFSIRFLKLVSNANILSVPLDETMRTQVIRVSALLLAHASFCKALC